MNDVCVTSQFEKPSERKTRILASNERVFGSSRYNCRVVWMVKPFAIGMTLWVSTTYGIIQVDFAWFRFSLFGQWRDDLLLEGY